ncbi:MAG: bifunctional isocitrate dehydrogenase kinase/phosphatase [Bacteroidota bacterium]
MFLALRHYDTAHAILMGYMDYYYRFKLITKRARIRFEQRDWHGIQADARARINLYREIVGTTTEKVAELLLDTPTDEAFWAQTKASFAEEIAHFDTRNIAETFYNSVYRHFHQIGADRSLMFVLRTGNYREYQGRTPIIYSAEREKRPLEDLVQELLAHYHFDMRWDDQERDILLVANRWREKMDLLGGEAATDRVELLRSVFYRNKSAYIVGRLVKDEAAVFPFILPLLHPEGRGILIDALLLEADQVSSIFSYHRSYFLADILVPSDMVDFLQSFLPTKQISELYNSIGFEKHGKTVFYRELSRHLSLSKTSVQAESKMPRPAEVPKENQFITAPGIRGMVMYVFTTASLNMVFKIIRDRFAPPKQVSAAIVKEKYELVKQHDRVGRMADSYLFEQLALPLDHFEAGCLEELQEAAPTKVRIVDGRVLISHVYIEKKMVPLNLFLETADEMMAQKALRDYGRAIKQLAAANIFPGDLLLKNFGVTRVKRVVFYDYDEIELVTDCNFRHIPEPQTPEQEMASGPWYYVGPKDIFPEEFPGFLMRSGTNLTYLRKKHGEIFDADFWNSLKRRLQDGEIMDVFPYRTGHRFLQ